VFTGALFGASGLSLLLTLPSLLNWRRRAKALRDGQPTMGTIARVDVDPSAINHRHPRRIEWSFVVGDKTFGGIISTWRSDAKAGKPVTVYYLARDPSCSVILLPDLPPSAEPASRLPWWKRL
jgi:hypothetical protein